jgi:hypothetical protein
VWNTLIDLATVGANHAVGRNVPDAGFEDRVTSQRQFTPATMNHQKFIEGIKQTGYPLENQTVEKLVAARWSIISNKYYLDSDNPQPREIDILAYKVAEVQGVEVVTALIISCKKSERNVWAFLTRKADLKNPNIDFNPLHIRTDYKPVSIQLNRPEWRESYIAKALEDGVKEALAVPEYQVFALQQMLKGTAKDEKSEGKPNNDSDMFASILSLMKAQFHEESLTHERKRPKPRVYQFNLVSLADTEFLRLHFVGDEIEATESDVVAHIASYIFEKRDTFSRITFVRAGAFERLLEDYGRLHAANKRIISELIDDFFHLILTDSANYSKRAALMKQFRETLRDELLFFVLDWDEEMKWDDAWLSWSDENKLVEIHLPGPREAINSMNADESVQSYTAKALRDVYRYEGRFEFR